MGKNKKKQKQAQQQQQQQDNQAQQTEHTHEHEHTGNCCGGHEDPPAETETDKIRVPVMDLKRTAQERADEYQENSMKIHQQFIEKFQAEEAALSREPDNLDKRRQLAKREQDEVKKLDKIIKKEKNDFEDVAGPGCSNAKLVHDKILRTIGNMRKVSKQYSDTKQENQVFVDKIEENKKTVEKFLKKKTILSSICDQFLKQNHDLYLKHETMLDEENDKRHKLAENFQGKMGELSEEINTQKVERQKAYDINQEIRTKIQKSIDDYKVREDNYRTKMEEFNSEVSKVQDSL